MTLAEWLSAHRYRVLDLQQFGPLVQARVAPQATHWLSPRWKTLPSDVVVTDDELAALSRRAEFATSRSA